jgi:hypothetical protein
MAKFPWDNQLLITTGHTQSDCKMQVVILGERRKITTTPLESHSMKPFLLRRFLSMMLIAGATGFAADAAEARSNFEILRISPLRIMCFTTPCPPWNAMAISQGTDMPGPQPLYLGRLPALRGPKPAVARIAKVWRKKDCVIIRGRLDTSRQRPTLFVSSILRSC